MEPIFRTLQIDDRSFVLIDDLFRPDFIGVFDQFLKGLRFSLTDYDTEDSRRVLHWIHEFSVEDVTSHPLLGFVFSRIKSATETVCAQPRIELKRIHCNASLYGDLQFPHQDASNGMTWLYYANSAWQSNWMGETIFYDSRGEPLYAVFPKPGRVIVFAGDIVHRGGVPSRECIDARRTLAFKFLNQIA
jgi:SM-20-related protein